MKACLIAYLLCATGVSASGIQASRVARLAAKARLGGDISQLIHALNSGLVLDARPLSVAELARQRLGMEAAELEQESLPDAMMLRAFVGSAPDSVLVMPPDMLGEPVMPRGLMVVEPGISASPLAVLPMEQQMTAPNLAVLPVGLEPTMVTSFDREPSVKDAVKRLTSEMRAVEENMGRKVLQDIISEFFAEASSNRAKKESATVKVEKESGATVAEYESMAKKAEEETEAQKAEKESEAKTAEKESVATRAEKESVVKKAKEESVAKKAEKESKGMTMERESMAARVEESAAKTAKEKSAVNKAKKESEGTKESITTRKESSVNKIEQESAAMGAEKMQTVRRADKESMARKEKEVEVKGVEQIARSSLLKTFAGHSHWAEPDVHRGHRHVEYRSPAHEATKAHQPAQHEALAHEALKAHQDAKHENSAREAPKEVPPAEKASLPAEAAKTIDQPLKDKAAFHGVAKAAAPVEQAARGFATTKMNVPHGMLDKLAMRYGRAWPKGNKDATWHEGNTLYRRTCSKGHCETKMFRRRK